MCLHTSREQWILDLVITTPEGYEGGRETITLCNACMAELPGRLAAWHRPFLPKLPAERAPMSDRARENGEAGRLGRNRVRREEALRIGRIVYERRRAGEGWAAIVGDLGLHGADAARYYARQWREAHDLPVLPRTPPTEAQRGEHAAFRDTIFDKKRRSA